MAAKQPKQAAKKSAPKQSAAPQPDARVGDNLGALQETPMLMTMELGRSRKTFEQVLELGEQSLLELDRQAGDPIDLRLNGVLFARGELVSVGENFGVRITELIREV